MKLRWEDTVEARARAVVECFLEDTEVILGEADRNQLLYQIEVAIHAQRTEYHVDEEDPRKRCLLHPSYKASLPPDLSSQARASCSGCWVVWRAKGNPPPP